MYPFYMEWRDHFIAEFEKNECYLGDGSTPFPIIEDRVAWEMEGFLCACYLALHDDVSSVEYRSQMGPSRYRLRKGKMEDELVQLLDDLEAVLSKGLGDY
jgi:hypothetical protein